MWGGSHLSELYVDCFGADGSSCGRLVRVFFADPKIQGSSFWVCILAPRYFGKLPVGSLSPVSL